MKQKRPTKSRSLTCLCRLAVNYVCLFSVKSASSPVHRFFCACSFALYMMIDIMVDYDVLTPCSIIYTWKLPLKSNICELYHIMCYVKKCHLQYTVFILYKTPHKSNKYSILHECWIYLTYNELMNTFWCLIYLFSVLCILIKICLKK